MKNNKAEIRQEVVDGQTYIYVLDKKGKCCFRREKTQQFIAIAHSIYMCEKYWERYEENQRRKKLTLNKSSGRGRSK
jgi:hypothetical protein